MTPPTSQKEGVSKVLFNHKALKAHLLRQLADSVGEKCTKGTKTKY